MSCGVWSLLVCAQGVECAAYVIQYEMMLRYNAITILVTNDPPAAPLLAGRLQDRGIPEGTFELETK